MAFGASLKRERELRGISLEEISKATRISIRFLDAIEMDRYDIFPEGIFRKSFIKSYAQYLGMNEDKVLQEYILATQAAPNPSAEEKPSGYRSSLKPPNNVRWVIAGLLALLMVGAICWHFAVSSENEHGRTVESGSRTAPSASPMQGLPSPTSSQPAANAPVQNSALRPKSPSGSQLKVLGELAKKPEVAPAGSQPSAPIVPAVTPLGSASTELTLGIHATTECWISVSSGDSPLYSGLLESEEVKRFSMQKPLKLTLGNAGGVKLSVNGKPLAAVGKPGEVQALEISPENYQRYLAVAH
jgi:cytoskeleton protein RodZ